MSTHFTKTAPLLKLALAIIATCAFLIHATASSHHPYAQETLQETNQPAQHSYASQSHKNTSISVSTTSTQSPHKDDLWAMAYTPYTSTGVCKLASEIQNDITRIAAAGFSAVRLYSTDCHILPLIVPTARRHSLTLLLGVHLTSCTPSLPSTIEQIADILAFAQWDLLDLLVVGNEAIFNGICTAPDLAALLDSTTSQLRAAGYSGPITTTEPLSVLAEHADLLCPRVDILASNIQPFFHERVSADNAGRFVGFQLQRLALACGGEEVRIAVNLETGWPSVGGVNGVARAGVEEQRAAVGRIRQTAGNVSVFASFEDEGWREGGEWGVENHWGCLGAFLEDKGS